MSEHLLFKCLIHSSPTPTFDLKEDEGTNWNSKVPPIVDILIVSDENIDMIPNDYSVVLNQSTDSYPKGSISYSTKRKGYFCIKRSYGKSCINQLQFFSKHQVEEATSSGYFIVKQYPECEMVSFSSPHSKEEYYLGMKLGFQSDHDDSYAFSISSILILSPEADLFDYPDYTSISTQSSLSFQFLYKQQLQLHRYQLFHLVPTIRQFISSMKDFPPNLEDIVFQEGIPIHISKSSSILEESTFHSFILYEANGAIFYGYSIHYWKEASTIQKQQCIERMQEVLSQVQLPDRINRPFMMSLENYNQKSCHLFYQNAISIISAFPYCHSINRLLLFPLFKENLLTIIESTENETTILPLLHSLSSFTLNSLHYLTHSSSFQSSLTQLVQERLFNVIGHSLIHSTPLPELGDTIILSLQESNSIRISRHYSRGFPIYDDNIAPLFLLLSSESIITILQLLLLEQKVLLHSYYPSLIINVAHTLKRLLFPWKYAGSFIPLLPSSMLLAVQVPGSYIIGVETKYLSSCPITQETVIVDLDHDQILTSRHYQKHQRLPENFFKPLLEVIQSIQKKIRSTFDLSGEEWKATWNRTDYHNRPKLGRKDRLELFTRILDMYSCLVDGYDRRIIYRESSDYVGLSLQQLFDCDGFVATFSKHYQSFIKEFISTQLFSNLITSRIEVSTFPSSLTVDFPIIFFDKYLLLKQHPFSHRYRHLNKVLYQRSNRILLVSIPVETPHVDISEEECKQEIERIKTAIIDSWVCCCESEEELLRIGNSDSECRVNNERVQHIIDHATHTPFPVEFIMLSYHVFCNYCKMALSLEFSLHYDCYSCPWCHSLLQPSLFLYQNNEIVEYPLLTPCQLLQSTFNSSYQLSSQVLSSLFIPQIIHSSLPSFFLPPLLFTAFTYLLILPDSPYNYQLLLHKVIGGIVGSKVDSSIENEELMVENVILAMFCLEESELVITSITPDVILLLHEILDYLKKDDLMNAMKLFLFSRGGDVHHGFTKSIYSFFNCCKIVTCSDMSCLNEQIDLFQNQFMKTVENLEMPASLYLRWNDLYVKI